MRFVLILCLALAACGPRLPGRAPDPVVDPITIKDQAKYEVDLAACRTLADKAGAIEGAAEGAAIGAGGGAIAGAAIGAIVSPASALATAGIGAVAGGTAGAGTGGMMNYFRQKAIMTNCLIGRGYRPLG